MTRIKYTKELLSPIVDESKSFAEVVKKLGLKNSGGNNSHIRKVIKQLGLDTSHFLGQSWSRGRTFSPKYDISIYLNNEQAIGSSTLRKRLIKEGYFKKSCSMCGLSEWLENPISLELHHKDGDHENNNLDNLSVLCPNCHSLTHSLARDCHKQKPKSKPKPRPKKNKCTRCNAPCVNKFCSQKCVRLSSRVVERPSKSQLREEIEKSNFTQVAKKYGVSDNAIRKWLKNY